MKRMLIVIAVLAPATAVVLSPFPAPGEALAQSGSRAPGGTPAQSGTRAPEQAHYDALWAWLKRVDYRDWKGVDDRAPGFEEGQSPHGALIKTYVNSKAASDLKNLPSGSVIVKENFSPDKNLMAITVMQRSKGYDPEHGDWYYAKYLPSGRIDRTPPEGKSMPIAGRFQMCIGCHSGAADDDYAFLND